MKHKSFILLTWFIKQGSRQIAYLLICFALLSSFASCSDPIPLKLTSAQRQQVDTLYNAQVEGLLMEMDSLCDAAYENRLPQLIDSILQERRAQEEILRNKYQKK
ncbi:MAG: hypothetical protein AAF242_14385 [Bacteroidota bacterium]